MLPNARLGVLLVPVGLLAAPNALAAGASVNPGLLVSGVVGDNSAFGLGGELSFMVFPQHRVISEQVGFGAFAQAQSYNFDHGRYALGLQFGRPVIGLAGAPQVAGVRHVASAEAAVDAVASIALGLDVTA